VWAQQARAQAYFPNSLWMEIEMTNLTPRETELVALGAAQGSNCVPCVEHHVPQARKAGLHYGGQSGLKLAP
jgi:AhpD family alkylhydroperoxidase